MNLKEIASLTGKNERTIRLWIEKTSEKTSENGSEKISKMSEKISEARKTSKPADFTLEETIAIIRAGGNETLANLLMQNASGQKAEIAVGSSLTSRDLDLISAIVAKTVAATTEILSGRLYNIESQIEKRKALLPAPEIKPRDAINKLVREYATKTEMPFNSIWNKVYTEFNYTYKCNVKTSAYNRDMTVIDYIETEGMIEQLLAVAVKILEA